MKFYASLDSEDDERIVDECFGPSIRVGFGGKEGSSSRGWVNESALRDAVRGDILDVLAPQYREEAWDVRRMMQIFFSPSKLFEFDVLARLFATQLAPTQVLGKRDAVFFSPARLRTFGLP